MLREAAPIIRRLQDKAVPAKVKRALSRAVKRKFGRKATKQSTNTS